jgi:hypothetical protein
MALPQERLDRLDIPDDSREEPRDRRARKISRPDALEMLVSNRCWVALAQATKARIQLLKIGTFYHWAVLN